MHLASHPTPSAPLASWLGSHLHGNYSGDLSEVSLEAPGLFTSRGQVQGAETRIPAVMCQFLSIHSNPRLSSLIQACCSHRVCHYQTPQKAARNCCHILPHSATSQIWCWIIPASTSSAPVLSRPVWKSGPAGSTWHHTCPGLAMKPPPEALPSSSYVNMTLMASLVLICLATRFR